MRRLAASVLALLLIPANASAIAFDTWVNKGVAAQPATNSFTATGSDLELVVCANHTSLTDIVTSVTFGSTNLTKYTFASQDAGGNTYSMSLWAGAITAGTQTITVNTSGGNVGFTAASYTGVAGGIDISTTTNSSYDRGAGTMTVTFNPTVSNTWSVLCTVDGAGLPAAGTGSTLRSSGVFPALFDSNTTITAPYSMTVTWIGINSAGWTSDGVGVTLNPTAAAAASPFVRGAAWWFAAW